MPRKIVLSLAMSLDGFLADPEGGYAWIRGDGSRALDAYSLEESIAILRYSRRPLMPDPVDPIDPIPS